MSKKRILITMTLICTFFISAIIVLVNARDAYVNTYALNVRGGNLWKDTIVKVIRKGDQVTILNDAAYGWKRIQTSDGTVGFVNGRYITENIPYIPAPATTNSKKVKITTFRAFVRDDNQDKIIAVVKDWETLQVVSNVLAKGSRLKVRITEPSSRYYGREGYIYNDIVEVVEYGPVINDLFNQYHGSAENEPEIDTPFIDEIIEDEPPVEELDDSLNDFLGGILGDDSLEDDTTTDDDTSFDMPFDFPTDDTTTDDDTFPDNGLTDSSDDAGFPDNPFIDTGEDTTTDDDTDGSADEEDLDFEDLDFDFGELFEGLDDMKFDIFS